MRELTVRHFFEGHASAAELQRDAAGSVHRRTDGNGVQFGEHHITDMGAEFTLTPSHLVRLVDAVARGDLSLDALDAVAFCLEASDRFVWDGDVPPADRIADTLFWLGTPEINYPLTERVLGKIRHFLVTGEATLDSTDAHPRRTIGEAKQVKINEHGV